MLKFSAFPGDSESDSELALHKRGGRDGPVKLFCLPYRVSLGVSRRIKRNKVQM